MYNTAGLTKDQLLGAIITAQAECPGRSPSILSRVTARTFAEIGFRR